ncbi:hypothetical protein QWY82_00320 [Simiduia curdlanivorans]|uniref:Uncharacterized protein n=1 Tax=Simiduia curdlanivorans TaxID=1492769 RepID=A0ABV8V5E6_9GAMM|nr:hypothetical protein [Simiduia curdlanivorans]MDN3637236.1 hypothetical protein [Simiduia curdlanivorans]
MDNPNKAYWTAAFGWLNIAVVALVIVLAIVAPSYINASQPGIVFTLALQLVVSAGLVFVGQQLRAGTDLGHKVYPAALVAYGLFLLMAARWLAN